MTPRTPGWVLGVDSGGSGLRFVLVRLYGDATVREIAATAADAPVRTGAGGIDADHLLALLRPAVEAAMADTGADRLSAAAIGAAGMASLGTALRERLPAALHTAFGVPPGRLALAADAVTAYVGALGMRPGAVVAAGTGMVAIGTGLGDSGWLRADGWGHLLGDCGGGAWIGRCGLEAAMRAHDGREGGSSPLLARVKAVFGPPAELPGKLYPRNDRAAVLASFAPEVARCADADPVAADILRTAARHILQAAAAVRRDHGGEVALTGGLFRMGEPLLAPLRHQAKKYLPGVRLTAPEGDPLHGAVRIAEELAGGALPLPVDPALLTLH
ncbi:ATPase [Streptomyces sp. RB6PN25]|uniref:ATPase n=1 Tax=Streptomyces humicola TaxID=2953240 RepID=A0ABT1Q076_9ACTN|nr:BadF/BadG/BcrA/BcrD ATPase family protein [Streptomyces humicola]MCQ4083326.1 ATPase [Streptomyces humicola]